MTDPTIGPRKVQVERETRSMQDTAVRELQSLADDLHRLANEIRDRISLVGDPLQEQWVELDAEVERFRRATRNPSKGAVSELRHAGFDLKRRLKRTRSKLRPGGR